MKKETNDIEEMKKKIEHRVARTRVSDFNKLRDYDATSELHNLLKQGFHVVHVNKIGDELEYIVERLV